MKNVSKSQLTKYFETRPGRPFFFFDTKDTKHLIVAAMLITFDFAAVYTLSSQAFPLSGFGGAAAPHITLDFLDGLYFSITTETTLGFGDIYPLGLMRLIVCAQVILGLIIAGLTVAKITSLPGGSLREVAHRTAGDWIEFVIGSSSRT